MRIKTDPGQFYSDGLRILQNMQDMKQSGNCRLPADPLETMTSSKDIQTSDSSNNIDSGHEDDFDRAIDLNEYDWNEEGYDYNLDLGEDMNIERDLSVLRRKERISDKNVIKARADESKSLILSSNNNSNGDVLASDPMNTISEDETYCAASKFNTLIGFASGFAVGNFLSEDIGDHDSNNFQLYSDKEHSQFITDEEWSTLGFAVNFDKSRIPTLPNIAANVAQERNILLDDEQYIAYEVICSSFLLNLINEESLRSANVSAADFGLGPSHSESEKTSEIVGKVKLSLKELGAKEQLLMFVTGPAGAGKSTAITVAQKYCFEFCKAIGFMWRDNTFLFTATTGVAASIFGGQTIHSVAHMNYKDENITAVMKQRWNDVKSLFWMRSLCSQFQT